MTSHSNRGDTDLTPNVGFCSKLIQNYVTSLADDPLWCQRESHIFETNIKSKELCVNENTVARKKVLSSLQSEKNQCVQFDH